MTTVLLVFLWVLKFFSAAVGVASLLMWVSSLVAAVNNPDLKLDADGKVIEGRTNRRLWFGLVASISWALFLVL